MLFSFVASYFTSDEAHTRGGTLPVTYNQLIATLTDLPLVLYAEPLCSHFGDPLLSHPS